MGAANLLSAFFIAWNVWTGVGGALFAYFAYCKKYEYATRRYPVLTLLQLVALNLWVNCYIFRTDLHLVYDPLLPFMAQPIAEFGILSVAIPAFMFSYALKGFSLTNEHFATILMLHESRALSVSGGEKAAFDAYMHMSRVERMFFALQQKAFGIPAVRATDGQGSIGIVRRYRGVFFARVLACVGVCSAAMVPLGLLLAGCWDPAVGYPQCMLSPYGARLWLPQIVSGLCYAVALPWLLHMLRNLNDPYFLKQEMCFNTAWLIANFVLYLLFDWSTFPFPDSLRGGVMWACGLPIVSITLIYFPVALCVRQMVQQELTRGKTLAGNSTMGRSEDGFQKLLQGPPRGLAGSSRVSDDDRGGRESDADGALCDLYLSYIKPGSHRELNLSHAVRNPLIAKYRHGKLAIDDFAPVAKEVFQMMLLNAYPQVIKAVDAAGGRRRSAI